jgi:hypothetical protein
MAPGAGASPWTTAPGLDGPGAVQWPMANGQCGRHGPAYQRRRVLASIHGRGGPAGDRSMGRCMCAMEGKGRVEGKTDLLLWRSWFRGLAFMSCHQVRQDLASHRIAWNDLKKGSVGGAYYLVHASAWSWSRVIMGFDQQLSGAMVVRWLPEPAGSCHACFCLLVSFGGSVWVSPTPS